MKDHIEWWQNTPVTERFSLMRKYEVKQVSDKLIKKMYNNEKTHFNQH